MIYTNLKEEFLTERKYGEFGGIQFRECQNISSHFFIILSKQNRKSSLKTTQNKVFDNVNQRYIRCL